jgi:hypothetical protein
MANFGAMPFEADAEGKLVFGKPLRTNSEIAARCLAAAMAATSDGAVAFSCQGESTFAVLTSFVTLGRYEGHRTEGDPIEMASLKRAA